MSATSAGGKAFFAGGETISFSNSARVDIYNTATNTWSTANLSQARYNLSATSAGGKAFFAGGYTGSGVSKRVDIYNAVTNTWSTASLSQARYLLSATSVGSKVFFAGGSSASGRSNVVDIYDTATNTWSVAKLSQARFGLIATSVGGKAFFAGGQSASGHSNLVDIYDTTTNTWSTATLSQARDGLSATTAGGKAFFAGGISNSGVSSRVDIYDTATIPTAITQGPTPTSQTACVGGTASTTVTVTGENPGGAPLSYQWYKNKPDTGDPVSGQTTATLSLSGITAAQAGSYYLLVSGGVWSSAFTLRVVALGMGSTNVTCNGGSNGTATVSASGGQAPYTYSWSPSGGTGATASGLSAGTYTVTVTDNSGVSCEKSVTITQPPALSITPSQTNVTCFGGINGTASVQVSGGKPGYTYDWSPGSPTGEGTASISGLAAGNYSVLITEANGCTTTQSFTITQPTAFSITPSQTNVTCNGGSNGTASVTVSGGSGSCTYNWYPGTPTGDGTNRVSGLTAGGSGSGVIITDAGTGCSITAPFNITQPTAVVPVISAGGATSFCAGGSVSLSTTVSFSTYSWKKDGNEVGTSATYLATTAGSYTVTVTNANGCSGTSSALSVTVKPLPTLANTGTACAVNILTYSVNFTSNGTVTSNFGIVSGNTVSGIPAGQSVTLTATLNGCTNPLVVTAPVCACPVIAAPISGGNQSICQGQTIPALSVSVGSGETVDWYSTASSGTLLLSGSLSYTPTGAGTFYAQTRNTTSGCISASRTAVTLTVKPLPTLANTGTACAGNILTYSVNFTSNGTVTSNFGTVSGNTVSGIPAGQSVTLTATLNGCTNPLVVTAPVCACPVIAAPISGGNQSICQGQTIPALSVSVGSGETVDWYSTASSGTLLLSGSLSYTPTGAGTFYAQTRNTTSGCISASRTAVTLTVKALSTTFNVTGGGSYCSGGSGVVVGLSGSQSGVNYQLKRNGNDLGSPVVGTGSGISFGYQTAVGTYTVVATSTTCTAPMSGQASVSLTSTALTFTSTPTVGGVPVCAGSPMTVSFSTSCADVFTVQLSNASGNFTSGVITLGTFPAGASSVTIPVSVPEGSSYRIRILSPGGGSSSNVSAAFRVRTCGNSRLAAEDNVGEGVGLQVRVSPNPTEGLLRVTVNSVAGKALRLELFNAAGQVVRQQQVEQAQAEESLSWDISRQPPGLYLLRVSSDREAKTVKVLH